MNIFFNKSNMNKYEIMLNRAFSLVDKLRGSKLSKHLYELNHFYASEHKKSLQHTRLINFIDDINLHVPYYKSLNENNIYKFPIISKNDIKDNPSKFMSNKYLQSDLIRVTTSGSYGTPMSFYRSKTKQMMQTAEVLFFGKEVNYYIGRNHAFIRGVSKSKIKLILQNEIHVDPTHLGDHSLIEITKKLKKTRFIIGFPSVIMTIIKHCEEYNIDNKTFNILGIITTSEALHSNQREKINSFFDCPVVARYATEELGIIGNQCIYYDAYHVNDSSFFVEVFKKDSDELADFGEEGRIIVTDMYSHAMPLVRYDTGDYGTLEECCPCGYSGRVLKTISGRKVENLLDANNNKVSPFSINVKMKEFENIYQFQFVQEDYNQYKLLLVSNGRFNQIIELLNELKIILGKNAQIEVNYVDNIPPLPSGKRPYIINKLNLVNRF